MFRIIKVDMCGLLSILMVRIYGPLQETTTEFVVAGRVYAWEAAVQFIVDGEISCSKHWDFKPPPLSDHVARGRSEPCIVVPRRALHFCFRAQGPIVIDDEDLAPWNYGRLSHNAAKGKGLVFRKIK